MDRPDAAAHFPIRDCHPSEVLAGLAGFKMAFEDKSLRSGPLCFEIVLGEGRINR